ncbi:hypothetical protein [Dactylosporangium darangshiense]|uniref:Uncharacterized protein n=1 Tax=Dactylosporangium darangshiense TaxID=579108 RepID=A0ABP8CZM8_9ACTN
MNMTWPPIDPATGLVDMNVYDHIDIELELANGPVAELDVLLPADPPEALPDAAWHASIAAATQEHPAVHDAEHALPLHDDHHDDVSHDPYGDLYDDHPAAEAPDPHLDLGPHHDHPH